MIIVREGQVVSDLRPACPGEFLLRGIAPPEASFGPDLLKLQVSFLLWFVKAASMQRAWTLATDAWKASAQLIR